MYAAATLMVILASITGILALVIPADPVAVAPHALPASCDSPISPSDSTYRLCAFPLNDIVMTNASAVRTYMTGHSGCKMIGGDDNGVTTSLKCDSSGPDIVIDDIPGWPIDSSFNPEVCIPGSKCL